MSIARTAVGKEEEGELNYLRDVADRSAADAAQTLAELARRVSSLREPRCSRSSHGSWLCYFVGNFAPRKECTRTPAYGTASRTQAAEASSAR
jgi:hypothetical protein